MATDHDVTEAELSAFADGNLPESRAAAVAEYLRRNPEAAACLCTYYRQDHALRTGYAPVLDEPVPEYLQAIVRRRTTRRVPRMAVAALLVASLALGVLVQLQWERADEPAPMAFEAVAMQVFGTGPSTAADGTDTLPPPGIQPPGIQPPGYELVDRRTLQSDGREVREYRYRDPDGERLGLYVSQASRDDDRGYRVVTQDDLSAVGWHQDGRAYVLVGNRVVGGLTRLAVETRHGTAHASVGTTQPVPDTAAPEIDAGLQQAAPAVQQPGPTVTNTGGSP